MDDTKRIISLAEALQQVVDFRDEESPLARCREALGRFTLSKREQGLLQRVSRRLAQAQWIVSQYKKYYGITADGRAKEARTLYEELHGESPPLFSSVRYFPFTMGVYLPARCFEPKNYGLTYLVDIEDVDKHLLWARRRVQRVENADLYALLFYINYQKIRDDGNHNKLINNRLVEQHEIKHIIDYFLHSPSRRIFFAEMAADLFAGDCKLQTYNKQEELKGMEEEKKVKEKSSSEKGNRVDLSLIVNSFPAELPAEIVSLGMSPQVLSHIVSLTSYSHLVSRLEEVELYLRKRR